jgi:ribosome-binding protein aMBF1 (putative translation factor)
MSAKRLAPMKTNNIEITSKNIKKIGIVLADVRTASGVSQTDLSKKMKKAQSFVCNIEKKVKCPGLGTTVAYLDKLGYKLLIVKK